MEERSMPEQHSPPPEPRFHVIHTRPRDPDQVEYLVGLLADDNIGTRWKAAQALGRLQEPAAVDALIRALRDEDERVQRKVIWALGSIGDPRAIAPLRHRSLEVNEALRDLIADAQELIRGRIGIEG
jgi:HEAT repeat protein